MVAPVLEGDLLAEKYVVEKVLGAGGMGVVVAARHVQLGSRVALKFVLDELARDAHAAARFMREAQSATRISSEHVARVLDVGQLASGAPYMVMEYLEGSDLARLVETQGPLSVADAIDYVTQACRALAEAHGKGIVHRDIKPSNLFLTRRYDGSALVKVLDFGIAKVAAAEPNAPGELTQTQAMMGSPLYASPEQLDSARHANERSDIWALGVTLHFLVSGRHPFVADSPAKLVAEIMVGKPTPLRKQAPHLPEELEQIILRCLERDPSRRFAGVGELVAALASVTAATKPVSGAAPVEHAEAPDGEDEPAAGGPGRTTIPHSFSTPPNERGIAGADTSSTRGVSMAWLAPLLGIVLVALLLVRGPEEPKPEIPSTAAGSAVVTPAEVRPSPPPEPPLQDERPAPSEPVVTPATSASTIVPAPSASASPSSRPAAPAPRVSTKPSRTKDIAPDRAAAAAPGERVAPAPPEVDRLIDERR